jgi:hypothetical protein
VDELDAGHARADDRHGLREVLRRVAVAGREDAVAVGLAPLGDAGTRAGGDERGVERDPLRALDARHLDLVRADEAGGAAEDADALALEQLGRRLAQVVLDAFDAGGQGPGVDLGDGLLEAHPGRAAQEGHGAAGGDHRLGGDAVPQVGRAADDVALDHRDVGAEALRVRGRGVPGRPSTDDHEASRHDVQATAPP